MDPKVLLLHGTKAPNAEGILRSGFDPSKYGAGDQGIYHTDSISLAYNFGKCYAKEHSLVKKLSYYFVNEIKVPNVHLPTKNFSKDYGYNKLTYTEIYT